jgi:adenylate cyclase
MHGRVVYCAAGDCVSESQAMQAYATRYGYDVITGQSTRDLAERSFAFLEIDTVVGGEGGKPVKLYALIGDQSVRSSPKFRAVTTFHDNIFQALRAQQWNRARELIEQCRKLSGARQKLYDLHLARIAWFEKHPPGPDWDGAFRPILK